MDCFQLDSPCNEGCKQFSRPHLLCKHVIFLALARNQLRKCALHSQQQYLENKLHYLLPYLRSSCDDSWLLNENIHRTEGHTRRIHIARRSEGAESKRGQLTWFAAQATESIFRLDVGCCLRLRHRWTSPSQAAFRLVQRPMTSRSGKAQQSYVIVAKAH